MDVFDCSAEPVRAGSGPRPRAVAKAADAWPASQGDEDRFEARGSRFEPGRARVGLEARRRVPASIREGRAWRTSSRALPSWRIAGPPAVVSEQRMEADALARTVSAAVPAVRDRRSW